MELNLRLPWLSGGKSPASPVIGDSLELLTGTRHGGKHYAAAKAGRIWTGNMAAAGAVIPIFSNTTQVCGIWNPKGSGVHVVPVRIGWTYVDTTHAAGGYVLGLVKNAPASTGTGMEGISAFTDGTMGTTIFNGIVDRDTKPKARFTPSAATVTAPIILRHLGLNADAFAATSAANLPANNEVVLDGDLIVPPGNAIFFAGNIATLSKLAVSLTWAEEDV